MLHRVAYVPEAKDAQNADIRAAVIVLEGNVMGGPDGGKLHQTLHDLQAQGKEHPGHLNVVVDLSKVSLMNSSGLGMLISGMVAMRNAGGDLRLAALPDRISVILSTTRMNKVFKQFPTVEEALASYDTPA